MLLFLPAFNVSDRKVSYVSSISASNCSAVSDALIKSSFSFISAASSPLPLRIRILDGLIPSSAAWMAAISPAPFPPRITSSFFCSSAAVSAAASVDGASGAFVVSSVDGDVGAVLLLHPVIAAAAITAAENRASVFFFM